MKKDKGTKSRILIVEQCKKMYQNFSKTMVNWMKSPQFKFIGSNRYETAHFLNVRKPVKWR